MRNPEYDTGTISRLVAIHIMGIKPYIDTYGREVWSRPNGVSSYHATPYAVDPSMAMSVVEVFRKEPAYWSRPAEEGREYVSDVKWVFTLYTNGYGRYSAQFSTVDHSPYICADAFDFDNPATAICVAALRAKGIEPKDSQPSTV